MMIESILGTLIGGGFRLAPEVLKWLDRKNERSHELALLDKNLQADKQRGEQRERELHLEAEITRLGEGLSALREALVGQFQKTGIRIIDALNVSVRPVITYCFFLLYAAVKVATFVAIINAGGGWGEAVKAVWTEADMALWSGILNFYFLGRVFEKQSRGA